MGSDNHPRNSYMNLSLSTNLNNAPNMSAGITIKSPQEIVFMRKAGRVVAETISLITKSIEPGMKTRDLDILASKHIAQLGAEPSFKGYRGFPATICTSINEEIVHGIPGTKVIRDGDIVSIDVGAIIGGYHGDSAVTVGVGQISRQARDLISATRTALDKGIEMAQAGNRIGDISWAVEGYATPLGYGVVREYVGHGIGHALHEEPSIPNFGDPDKGPLLIPGMVIAIEPMLNIGGWKTRQLPDKWTVVTADGSLSAHFEHTVLISKEGPQVLTSVQ
jgi:methionyl aminopeptidase